MIRGEQEIVVIDNRGNERLLVSSTHPVWTRKLTRLEQRGLARRTRTILDAGTGAGLGAEWEIDRDRVGLRLSARRKLSDAQRAAATAARNARSLRRTSAGAEVPPDAGVVEGRRRGQS